MSSIDAAGRADKAAGLGPGECVPAGEAAAIGTIVAAIEAGVRAAAQAGPARRDAHAKAHGCVRARFEVLDNLDPSLRIGVFAQPRVFDAWIRFSNGSGKPQKDSAGDGRGMAVKLMNVADSPSTTQDFVMINHPVFFVRNAVDYIDLETSPSPLKFFFPSLNPFRWRLHEGLIAVTLASQKVLNPLNTRYWSMTPYRWGDDACKFSARPSGETSPFVQTATADFLHDNLAAHLADRGATFDFLVQPRTRPASMPVEDPTIIWDEAAAPFRPVARITIPPQTFDSPEQKAFCENLSFTPGHCIDAHRPLGGLNRVRLTVYDHISRLRHALNNAPRREPVDFTV